MTGITIPGSLGRGGAQEPSGGPVTGFDESFKAAAEQAPEQAAVAPSPADDTKALKESLAGDLRATLETFLAVDPNAEPKGADWQHERLLQSYAQEWMQPLVDDRGNVLREGSDDPVAAMDAAMDFFDRYAASDEGPNLLRKYMAGGQIPPSFLPPKGRIEGVESFLERRNAEMLVEAGREEHPAMWAVYDHVLDPIGGILPAAVQVGANLAIGGANLARTAVGAEGQIDPIDVKARFQGLGQGIVTGDVSSVRAQLDAAAKTSGRWAEGIRIGGEFIGTAVGFSSGAVGQTLGVFGKAGGAVGSAVGGNLLGNAGRQIGHSAAVFGAYEGISAQEGERLERMLGGAGAGAFMGSLHATVAAGLRRMVGLSQKQLSASENTMMDSLRKWAVENKVFREKYETNPAYDRRLVDIYISKGMPNAPRPMPVRKLIGHAAKSVSDAAGFSAIDPQFREDLVDAWVHGDPEKWAAVITRMSGNFLGAAGLRVAMSDIVPLQRKTRITPTGVEPKPEPPKPEPMVDVQKVDPRDLRTTSTERVRPEDAPRQPKAEWNPWDYKGDQKVDPKTLKAKSQEKAVPDEVRPTQPESDPATGLLMDARRSGWDVRFVDQPKPKVRKSARQKVDPGTLKAEAEAPQRDPSTGTVSPPARGSIYQIEGTDHSFRVEGDIAYPSDALRKATGLPESLSVAEIATAVTDAARLSNLRADVSLPGMKVDATTSTHAVPGVGDAPGTLRRAVLGEVQESPLAVPQVWKAVSDVVARQPEALDPPQAMVVRTLKNVLNSDTTLDPVSREILRGVVGKMDTVSARTDQSVAETMQAMPEFMKAIESGTPAADVVRAMADSLTTKTPEMAMQDMAKAQEVRADEIALREERAIEESTFQELTSGDRSAERPGEAGAVIGPAEVARLAEPVVGSLASLPKAMWDSVQRDQIQRVEDMGMPDIAEIGRKQVDTMKTLRARFDTVGLIDLRRTPRAVLDSSQDLVAGPRGGYAPRFAISQDSGLQSYFGQVSLARREAEVASKHRAVSLERLKAAQELGMQSTDASGKNPQPIVADPGHMSFAREFTPETARELREGSGPRYDAITKWLEGEFNWTREDVQRKFTTATAVTALDVIETRRSIPYLPTHFDIPSLGSKPTRVMETRPKEHAEKIAFRSSHVMGARSEIPRDIEIKEGAERFTEDSALEPLPQTALNLLTKVQAEHGRTAAQAVQRMLRATNGLSLERPDAGLLGWMRQPGQPGYEFQQFIGALGGTARASMLTMSWVKNVMEPISNIPFFGTAAVMKGYADVLSKVGTREFAEMHRRAVEDQWVADTKVNDPLKGENLGETINNSIRVLNDVIYSPTRMSQDLVEMVNVEAARTRLAAMQAGEGSRNDAAALNKLGFKKPEIDAMLEGNGTPEQYARYRLNIQGKLAGGRSLASAEKSDAAHSRGFNSLVWFTNFAQARTRLVDLAVKRFVNAEPGDRVEAFRNILSIGTATVVSGALGVALSKWVSGGTSVVEDWGREFAEANEAEQSQQVMALLAGGIGGGLATPIADAGKAFTEPGDDPAKAWAMAAVGAIGPLNAASEMARFLGSLVFGKEFSGYEGKTDAGKVGHYLRRVMPAARVTHEGLFGLAAITITDKNPQLDDAMDSYFRWLAENKPHRLERHGKDPKAEQREWRLAMRKVIDLVMSDRTFDDQELVDAIVDAQVAGMGKAMLTPGMKPSDAYKEARNAVASSLDFRKVLPDPNSRDMTVEETDALVRHLGDTHVETLRDYDATLDMMSKRVRRLDLRGAIAERAGR